MAARPGLPISLAPRGLSRVQAAAYIGVSPGLFDALVAEGAMPPPKCAHSRMLWDRFEIDEAFAALPPRQNGPTQASNPCDQQSEGPE